MFVCLFGIASPEWGCSGLPTFLLRHVPNLMSYGQSNIILPIRNIVFTRIYVIHKLICDLLDQNLGKIQLQFTAIYFASTFAVVRHERHLCVENSSPTAHAQSMGYIWGFYDRVG